MNIIGIGLVIVGLQFTYWTQGNVATDPCQGNPCNSSKICIATGNGTYSCSCPAATCPTPTVNDTVCGCNQITYASECEMVRLACLLDTLVTVAHRGSCKSIDEYACQGIRCPSNALCQKMPDGSYGCICHYACPSISAPVCGSDGISYPNRCTLEWSACQLNKEITVRSNGPCSAEISILTGNAIVKFSNATQVNNTCLRVLIFDSSQPSKPFKIVAEAAYHTGKMYVPIAEYSYAVHFSKDVSEGNYSLSAVLNINWCSQTDQEWARAGDFLTAHPVTITIARGTASVENVNLQPYTPDLHCMSHVPCAYDTKCLNTVGRRIMCTSCGKICTRTYKPVCGSDGTTYPNACMATLLNPCRSKTVTVKYTGACEVHTSDSMSAVIAFCIVLATCLVLLGATAVLVTILKDRKRRARKFMRVKEIEAEY